MKSNLMAIAALASAVWLAGCDQKAVTINPGETVEITPSLRRQVDARRDRVWLLTRNEVIVESTRKPGRTVIALRDWIWADEQWACPPDLAIGPKGEAVITSNILPILWRVDPESLAVSVHEIALNADTDKEVGFSGLAYSAAHGVFFGVSELDGTRWRIDPALTKAQKLEPATDQATGRMKCAIS